MRTNGRLIALALMAGLAAHGSLAETRLNVQPVRAIACEALGYKTATVRADEASQLVKITAGESQFTPDLIVLKKGQPVTLQLTSTDRIHGLAIRALKIDTDIRPGQSTEITVTPQVAGTFKGFCDHYCGLGHGNMKMTVVVE